ncbi:MAG: DUF3500 domain-containing protein, partial [Myxococcota bacterium]
SLSSDARASAVLLDQAPADIVMGNRSALQDGATVMKLHEIFRRRPGDDDLMERMRRGGAARDAEIGYGFRDHELLSMTLAPKGIRGADLDVGQKDRLDRLVRAYHDGLPAGLASSWNVDDLYFAWAGPLDAGANYYRIQGESMLIEWDNSARNGNHAHSVVRHLSNDFGGDALQSAGGAAAPPLDETDTGLLGTSPAGNRRDRPQASGRGG